MRGMVKVVENGTLLSGRMCVSTNKSLLSVKTSCLLNGPGETRVFVQKREQLSSGPILDSRVPYCSNSSWEMRQVIVTRSPFSGISCGDIVTRRVAEM